jgi:cytochrome b561
MFYRKSVEERIADRMAQRRPLEEGKTFEHGPAKFVFVSLIVAVVLMHVVGLAVVMTFDF